MRGNAAGPDIERAYRTAPHHKAATGARRQVFLCAAVPEVGTSVFGEDTAAYEAFYMSELAELPGVGRVNSQFTMKLVKG